MKSQYPEAVTAIQTWISNQKLLPGQKLPPARFLAEQINFSHEVTERACNILIARRLITRTGYKLVVSKETSNKSPIKGIVYVVSYAAIFPRVIGEILSKQGVQSKEFKIESFLSGPVISALRKAIAKKPAGIILCIPFWIKELEDALPSIKIPMIICTTRAPIDINLNLGEIDLYRCTENALLYLKKLGHRQIAHLTLSNEFESGHEITDYYRTICLQLGLKQSASNIWQAKMNDSEVIQDTLLEQHKRHPEVTALFSQSISTRKQIPKGLSVVSLYENELMRKARITTIGLQQGENQLLRWACNEIISLIQTHESGLPPPPTCRAFFTPSLIIRDSCQALTPINQEAQTSGEPALNKAPQINLKESWNKIYPPIKESGNYWKQLDLSKLANHSITRKFGWLGIDPLRHFSSGLQSIHGVPFEVIDQTSNQGQAVITFRSPHSHSASGEKLPITAKIPIRKRVKALYFLHGCGWVKFQEPFAEYQIHFTHGESLNIPLIPAGEPRKSAQKHATQFQPNIQDWWPNREAEHYPHAHYATVFNPADPQEYERTLYTLEWINPRPDEEISSIEVRVDPKAGPALALIAITALL